MVSKQRFMFTCSIVLAFLFISSTMVTAQVLMSDDFSGTMIDGTKWDTYNNPDGGTLTQNDKIFWNFANTTASWTGHGFISKQSFENGVTYIIEGDYEVYPSIIHPF